MRIAPNSAGQTFPTVLAANCTLLCCMFAYGFSLLDRQILAMMVQLVKKDLGLTDFQIGLLQGLAFAILFGLLTVPAGFLADRLNRKRLIAAGVFFWSAATICCGLAHDFQTLFLARMCVGVGEAVLLPTAYSMLSDSFRPERLVWATTTFGFGAFAGIGVSLLLGGLIVDYIANAATAPFGLTGVAGWRVVFFIAGAPGILLAALFLFLREPERHGTGAMTDEAGRAIGLRESVRYLWGRRRIYVPVYAAPVILGTIVNGSIAWMPTLLIRNFGLSYRSVGFVGGSVQIFASFAGALLGASLAQRLLARGYRDGHLRALMFIALAAIIPATVTGLMPSLPLLIAFWLLTQIILCSYLGVAMAALQLRTPNRLRALNSAICVCLQTLFGLSIGSGAVSALTQFVFHDERSLGYSLAILSAVCAPLAAALMWSGLRPHREDRFA